MRLGLLFRLYVLWGFVVVTTSVTKAAKRKVFEAEPVEGVWSDWEEWSGCSQTCGVGVSQRSRTCLPPPPQQPLPSPTLHLTGQDICPGATGVRSSHLCAPTTLLITPGNDSLITPRRSPPIKTQDCLFYRSPYHAPSQGYNQPARTIRRPINPGAERAVGSRRSVSANREGLTSRRSSAIRPGQFGYGRVPFSLPLHRQNRQARHTVNGTDAETAGLNEDDAENNKKEEEETGSDGEDRQAARRQEALAALLRNFPQRSQQLVNPTATLTDPHKPTQSTGGQESHPLTPSLALHHHLCFPIATALTGTLSIHRELHPGFAPTGDIYPLQHPHIPHMGGESGRDGGRGAQVYRCSGPEKEYRRCFFQVCGGGALDSRAQQCAAFNTQEFMGRLYNWEPFTEVGADKQCELTCRPAGYRFYVRQAERVRDGTPCFNVSTNDICLEGQCLTEGCNGVLGSGSVIDKCGVCGGRESSCRKVTGSFQNVSVPLGYHKILDIPPGATFINITERRASPNYLAMRSGTGASVVNGRWAVDPPGEYQAGGTTFTYNRPRAQAEGEEEKGESLGAPGPTTTQLQLY
ncbi:ADAMTS-like protein 4, partial [Dissostichus eleginoides]